MTRTAQRRRVWSIVGVALALVLVASACGDDDDDDSASATTAAAASTTAAGTGTATTAAAAPTTAGATTTTAAKAPCTATVAGSKLNVGLINAVTSLDPIQSLGSYFGGTELIGLYDTLFRFDYDTFKYEPQAGESITPNADFTEWTLKLKPNLKFSNGDPYNVDALFAAMARFSTPGVRNSSITYLKYIKTQTKVDDYTAKFTLTQAWSTFPYVFAREPGEVVNVKAIGADAAAFGQKPPPEAGIGPYVLEKFAPNDELVFKARSDYWGGPVCIERLRFVLVPGGQATYDAYKNGDLDVALLAEPKVINAAEKAGEGSLTELQDASVGQIFNLRQGRATADPRVREAIMLAIDSNLINQRGYDNALDTSTRALVQKNSTWYTPAIKEMAGPDVAKAKELVAAAKAAGYDGKIEIGATVRPELVEMGLAIEAMLDNVGFDATLKQFPGAEFRLLVIQGDFEMGNSSISMAAADAAISLAANLKSDSPANYAAYKNPQMDALIDKMLAAPDRESAKKILADINNLFVQPSEVSTFPVGARNLGLIYKAKVKGIKQNQSVMYHFDDAYIQS